MKNRHLTAKSFAENAYYLMWGEIKEVNYENEEDKIVLAE
jgi:hypothetical protein